MTKYGFERINFHHIWIYRCNDIVYDIFGVYVNSQRSICAFICADQREMEMEEHLRVVGSFDISWHCLLVLVSTIRVLERLTTVYF